MRLWIVALLIGFGVLVACGSTTTGSSSTVCDSWGCKVAAIDGDAFSEDDPATTRANFLLNSLAPRCSLTPERVADMAVVTRNILNDTFGIVEKVATVLEAVNSSTRGLGQFDCAEIFAAYTVLRGS